MRAVWQTRAEREVRVLGRDEVLRLPSWRDGSSVRVMAGTVIVTREGDPEDHVVQAGSELRLPGRGVAVAWALEPSWVEVSRGREERVRERPAPIRALPLAR
jgi:hypothetical protein